MKTPDDLFKGHKAAVLLFLTEDENNGHWLCVLDHPDEYEVFDSFGTAIDGDRRWLSKEKQLEFGEVAPLLSNLLKAGNKPVTHNTAKLQEDDNDTCGRWVCARILNAHMRLPQFVQMMKGSGKPDITVTKYIYSKLGK